jgi:signal peptidase II
MTTVAALVTISLVAWMTNRYRRAAHSAPLERIGAGILLGGALGNLYDRFTLGQVTDFLEFSFMTFPIFNVADALIDLGIVLIFFAMIKEMRQSHAGN